MAASFFTDRRKSILLIIFAGLGSLGLLGWGLYLVISSLSAGLASTSPTAVADMSNGVLDGAGMFFCLLPLAVMIYYNVQQLRSRKILAGKIPPIKFWQLVVIGVVWFVILLGGSVVVAISQFGWIPLVVVFPLGLVLPVAALFWIAAGGLPGGSRRRLASVFGIGLVGSPALALVAEYLVIGLAVLVVGLFSLAHPEWLALLKQLKSQITNATDIQTVIPLLAPYLANPLVLVAILAFVAGIGPLIEEAMKPLAVWLVGKRLHSPAEGFALGALCGAGFALLEGLSAASGAAQSWGIGIGVRAFSSLMHICASGIMGWGIASAVLEKRYLHLAGAYLTSFLIHALWNGSVVLLVYGAAQIGILNVQPYDFASLMIMLVGLGMLLLLLGMILVFLPLFNRQLRPTPPAPATRPPEEAQTVV